MDKLHKSTTVYVKSLSKRNEIEDKEKILPVSYLGQTMIRHGEDFEPDSEFGNCLISMYCPITVPNRWISAEHAGQVWDERTTGSVASRRHMLRAQRQTG